MKEQWKAINGYEGIYEISNLGRVKSLKRKDATILKLCTNMNGYKTVHLWNRGGGKTKDIHTLVWDAFGNGKRNSRKLQVDHKDENKFNNNIGNLQLLTNRENSVKYRKTQNTSSKYIGVCWYKITNRWKASIRISGIAKHLGYFHDEYEAHLAYQKALAKYDT